MSLYVVSIVELISIINTRTYINIARSVEITNIELFANTIREKPNLELLCDIVMNKPRLSSNFSLREKTIPIPLKVKFSLYAKLGIVTLKKGGLER